MFGLSNSSSGVNVSIAVSYDYEKDVSNFFVILGFDESFNHFYKGKG